MINKKNSKTKFYQNYPLMIAAACAVITIYAYAKQKNPPAFFINTTESAPIGIYKLVDLNLIKNQLLFLHLPENLKKTYAKYYKLSQKTPLLKPVAAIAGEHVCIKGMQIFVNFKLAGRIKKQNKWNLSAYPICRKLEPDELYVGDMSKENSFDSRYFGPVSQKNDVIGAAKNVLLCPKQSNKAFN